jgi:CRISPR/Cas system-associated endoribonuclease Cas2
VFEGRITAGQADDLESLIRDRVRDSEGESAIIYRLGSEAVINRVAVGEDPSEDDQFL